MGDLWHPNLECKQIPYTIRVKFDLIKITLDSCNPTLPKHLPDPAFFSNTNSVHFFCIQLIDHQPHFTITFAMVTSYTAGFLCTRTPLALRGLYCPHIRLVFRVRTLSFSNCFHRLHVSEPPTSMTTVILGLPTQHILHAHPDSHNTQHVLHFLIHNPGSSCTILPQKCYLVKYDKPPSILCLQHFT
jgi:hypothetical protein